MPRIQIFVDDGMYFYGMCRSLPHQDWKSVNEVAWFLLRGIISRFGFPLSVESDNETVFVAELLQLVCNALNIKWKLYTAYRPQRSRMVERMNRTIKVTLAKWVQETGTPLDGLVAINVKEHQHDTCPRPPAPFAQAFPLWDNVREAPPTYSRRRGKFITKRRDGGVAVLRFFNGPKPGGLE